MARPQDSTPPPPPPPPDRSTICFGLPGPNDVALPGDARFPAVLANHYNRTDAIIQESAIALKDNAREASHDDFWQIMSAGIADIFNAQLIFISTRVTHDRTTGKALPQIGERGSYLNALALYVNDGNEIKAFEREVLYKAWDCPCEGMKYGKVFIIPSEADKFTPENPNAAFLPFTLDAYMGLPIFHKGINVGHFGLVWTKEGNQRRNGSWGFIEAILHSFEDLVLQRVMRHIEKDSLSHWRSLPAEEGDREALPTLNSFKPHAHILSHELRTPMQGVVGMLDLVQVTVQEAIDSKKKVNSDEVLRSLKEDITAVQDSSKRAVEATENIIEAYKLDMGLPLRTTQAATEAVADAPTRIQPGPKARRLSGSAEAPRGVKRKFVETPATERQFDIRKAEYESTLSTVAYENGSDVEIEDPLERLQRQSHDPVETVVSADNGLQHCKISDLVEYIINESFNVGGRPESIYQEEIEHGQILHAQYRPTEDTTNTKIIKWEITDYVPETILVHERDLAKLVSCVFQNAVKFTSTAHINLNVDLDPGGRLVVFNVCDTGPGIHADFRPKIFQPFTKEDNSTSRRTEGLGLGLLVAKGLAGKLGGDLSLVRSETEGDQHGSEFEIRIPLYPNGACTPQTMQSAPPSVIESAIGPRRRRSSAGSQTLKPPEIPPFGVSLSQEHITPVASSEVSPKLSVIEEIIHKGDTTDTDAEEEPLTFLVVEDNQINRKLLINMLIKLGHARSRIYEAYDGADAVRQVTELHAKHAGEVKQYGRSSTAPIDLVLMDIWMPNVDGYEATERILALYGPVRRGMRRCISEPGAVPMANSVSVVEEVASGTASFMIPPTILAVTADATDDASARAAQAGMDGFIAKPFKLRDLEKLVKEAEKKRARNKERVTIAT